LNQATVTIRLLEGAPAEMRELQRVLEDAPVYAHRITGVPPGRADAQSTYTVLPDGKSYADKFVFAINRESEMVGCADLIRGYPDAATALLEQYIRDWRTCDRVRIGVVRSNAEVIPFWTRLGFEPTGEVKPYRYGSVASETVVFQKRLPGTP